MMNLREYRRSTTRLADFLPWAALVDKGVVLNKDGSFQRTAKFRGPDLDSAVPAELVGDAERKAEFEEEGIHFESSYFLTLLYLPPAEDAARAERFLYEGRERAEGANAREALHGFVDRTDRVLQLVEGFMPESAWLDDAETLTYLHATVSTKRQR